MCFFPHMHHGFWSLSPDPAVPNSKGGQALDQLPPPPRPSSTAPLRLGSDFEVLKVMSWRSDMDQMACTVLEVWNINGVPSNSMSLDSHYAVILFCFLWKDHTCPPDSQLQVVRLRCLPIWGDSRRRCLAAGAADNWSTSLDDLPSGKLT